MQKVQNVAVKDAQMQLCCLSALLPLADLIHMPLLHGNHLAARFWDELVCSHGLNTLNPLLAGTSTSMLVREC